MIIFDEITMNATGERFAILIDRFRNLAYLAKWEDGHWEIGFDYDSCRTDIDLVAKILNCEGCKKQGYIFDKRQK
ncbi:MAG TPA: hypothetical protein VN374_07150 [Desulfitobacteriaceae bacterium]|nr:hypothetical protein [Desulfitobacteriaceae bacterium]